MYVIDRIVAQEKKRNLEMQEAYKQKISKLPQGQLYVRTLNSPVLGMNLFIFFYPIIKRAFRDKVFIA